MKMLALRRFKIHAIVVLDEERSSAIARLNIYRRGRALWARFARVVPRKYFWFWKAVRADNQRRRLRARHRYRHPNPCAKYGLVAKADRACDYFGEHNLSHSRFPSTSERFVNRRPRDAAHKLRHLPFRPAI